MVRCEYCGQLYEGLSCPHCCAPRGEPESVEHDGVSSDDCPEWIRTNSSCVGNNNVQVIGDNNVVNGLYADNVLYYVYHDVWPDDQPSERDETIDAICGTCSHDAQISAQVEEQAKEQAKKRGKDRRRWAIINFICAWFGTFSLGVIIGAPIGFAVVVATVFCALLLALCIGVGNGEDNDL
jgi:hypothetical protein